MTPFISEGSTVTSVKAHLSAKVLEATKHFELRCVLGWLVGDWCSGECEHQSVSRDCLRHLHHSLGALCVVGLGVVRFIGNQGLMPLDLFSPMCYVAPTENDHVVCPFVRERLSIGNNSHVLLRKPLCVLGLPVQNQRWWANHCDWVSTCCFDCCYGLNGFTQTHVIGNEASACVEGVLDSGSLIPQ